jgi:hypothetical protein
MNDIKKFAEEVEKELIEMKATGIRVPKGAMKTVTNINEMAEYIDMSVSECADLLVSLG